MSFSLAREEETKLLVHTYWHFITGFEMQIGVLGNAECLNTCGYMVESTRSVSPIEIYGVSLSSRRAGLPTYWAWNVHKIVVLL